MENYKNRNAVPEQYKVDLSDYFESEEKWKEEYNRLKEDVNIISGFAGKLSDSKELERYLIVSTEIAAAILNLYVYAMVKHDLNLENEVYTEMFNQSSSLLSKYSELDSFSSPEILSFSADEFSRLFDENPKLNEFKVLLQDVYRQKKHVLSKKEEELISILSDTFSSYGNISSLLINSEHNYGVVDVDGVEIELAANNYSLLMKNQDENVRKCAQKQFFDMLSKYQKTASMLLNSYVKNKINIAKVRNYNSPWELKLDNIQLPNEVFLSLKKAAKDNASVWQDYYKLMKKVLNLDVLHSYDTGLDWGSEQSEFTVEETQVLIQNALSVLGTRYSEKLNKVFDNHYIDYCQYKGKVNGGYSVSSYDRNSRIVLSFNGNYSDVSTIAHEAGHNVHHQYIVENNPLWYRDHSTFCAEVASLTNEFLLNQYMTNNGETKEIRLKGIENTLKVFQSNFFGAVLEGELEEAMYKYALDGNSITSSFLNDKVESLLKEYQDGVVEKDEYTKLMWIRRSHYYMFFYLYSYAVCASVAAVLASKIGKDEKLLNQYEEFLSCGSDMKPLEVYKKLNIDLTDSKVFEEGILYFKEQLELYEKIKYGDVNG